MSRGNIKYVKRNFFLPLFREAQKERGHETPYAGELGEELERWNRESYDQHVVQKVGRTPLEPVPERGSAGPGTAVDDALGPGGVQGAERPARDWHVQFEKAFYTVPHRLIGERVLVLGNSQVVRIFRDFQEVTAHPRAKQSWQVMRRPEHAPPRLEQYLNLTHEGLVQWASRLGPSVALVAQEIFADQGRRRYAPGARAHQTGRQVHDAAAGGLPVAARCTSPRPATAASRTSWSMNWTDCQRSNPRSRRTDKSSSGSAREHGYFDTDHATATSGEPGTPAWTN